MENKNRTKEIKVEDALNKQWLEEQGYQYAWVQSLSEVMIGPLALVDNLDKEDLLEARIFQEEAEIHVFPYDNDFKAIKTEKFSDDVQMRDDENLKQILIEGKGDYFEEKQVLRKRGTMTLRHYLECDEDGLARVSSTVLCGYEKGDQQ